MTSAPDIIDLRAADDAPPLALDPRIFERNVAALRTQNPSLADALSAAPPRENWRAVAGLDGSPTYRVQAPGAPAQWLDETAAPRIRAAGLLAEFRCGDTNAALPGIATGAELAYLLEHLPAIRAVFVFEPELEHLAAVLRIRDFAGPLASLRVVLVPPQRAREALHALLRRHGGLLPPGSILRLPGASAAHVEQVRAICEQTMSEIAPARIARLRELASARPASGHAGESRLAVVAFEPDVDPAPVDDLLRAAAGLRWEALGCVARGPLDVHLLPHAERLASFDPTLAICVGHAASRVPFPPRGAACEWHVSYPPQPPSDTAAAWHLAATPRIADALRGAGVPADKVLEWCWAVDSHAIKPIEVAGASQIVRPNTPASSGFSPESPRATIAAVATPRESAESPPWVFVGDLPDDSPAALGIEQPTHRLVWQHACEAARTRWQAGDIAHAEALLRHAERTARLPLDDAAARMRLVQSIQCHAAPAAIARAIVAALHELCGSVGVVGRGWGRVAHAATLVEESATRWLKSNVARSGVAAAVFPALPDPLSNALVQVAAAGIPVLIHAPAQFPLAKWLGGVLVPNEHVTPFTDAPSLRDRVQNLVRSPSSAGAQSRRAAAHLFRTHTYGIRLAALGARLGIAPSRNT
ncbi:MAG: hypothetical protein AB7Q17_11570 [Phycisphaerae bacterium]